MTQHYAHLPDPRYDAQFYDGVRVKRLFAWVIDVCIVTALTFTAIIGTLGLLAFFFVPLVFAINLLYRIYGLKTWSATIGMRLTGIELRNLSGNRLSTAESVWHTCGFLLLFISMLGILANALCMVLSDRGQGLHDLFVGTTAINRPAD